MKETTLSVPELVLVVATRVILGVGAGLLLAGRLSNAQRRPLGLALLGVGVLTTVPLGLEVLNRSRLRSAQGTERVAVAPPRSAEELAR